MKSTDVSDSLDEAPAFTELNTVKVMHKARLLSDNGPCYMSGELAEYLKDNNMVHTRAKPCHPQTQVG
jgi:transposase InsO family protein